MHAYLIIGPDKEQISKRIEELTRSSSATMFVEKGKKIEEIRALTKKASFRYDTPVFFILEDIDAATPEAMNAFLKTLEEPSNNVNFILTAHNTASLLPTILSRTTVIRLTGDIPPAPNTDFFDLNLGGQLEKIEKIKKREEAIAFLNDLLYNLHSVLLDKGNEITNKRIASVSETLTKVQANGNVGVQLTALVIQVNDMRSRS